MKIINTLYLKKKSHKVNFFIVNIEEFFVNVIFIIIIIFITIKEVYKNENLLK